LFPPPRQNVQKSGAKSLSTQLGRFPIPPARSVKIKGQSRPFDRRRAWPQPDQYVSTAASLAVRQVRRVNS
jgi:hypothetical protein